MSDPHVESLVYDVRHSDSVDYSKAEPLDVEQLGFRIRIDKLVATVSMIDHYAKVEEARAVVERFLQFWEIDAGIRHGPGAIEFVFKDARIIDRSPTPGTIIHAQPGTYTIKGGEARLVVGRRHYPAPSVPYGIINGAADTNRQFCLELLDTVTCH